MYSYIGAVGLRKFTDQTIPLGTSSVQYIVTGQRGTETGLSSSPFTVHFGVGGSGLTITSQLSGDSTPAKMAA